MKGISSLSLYILDYFKFAIVVFELKIGAN